MLHEDDSPRFQVPPREPGFGDVGDPEALGRDEAPVALTGNRGLSEYLAPAETKTLVDVRAVPRSRAGVIAVTLTAENPYFTSRGVYGPAKATLYWGAGSTASGKADVDFMNGSTVAVPADWLRVDATNEGNLFGFQPPGGTESMLLGAFASWYPVGKSMSPRRTAYINNVLAPGGQAAILVPPYSGTVVIQRTPFGESFHVDFLGRDTIITQPLYAIDVAAGDVMQPIELSNDIVSILITNTGAGSIDRLRAIFSLMLG